MAIQQPVVPSAVRSKRTPGLWLQTGVVVAAVALTVAAVLGIRALVVPATPTVSATPGPERFLLSQVGPAPDLRLLDQSAADFELDSLRGSGVLVFFGYTHCPDVCPATVGIIVQVLERIGGLRAVYVTVDPERDTPAWLTEYVRYMPAGFTALTGTPSQIRVAADAWGVRYARVETDDPAQYSMTHTANVYLVDQAGLLRAVFPFGTQTDEMAATVSAVLDAPVGSATTPTAPPPPSAAPTPAAPSTAPTSAPTFPATATPGASETPALADFRAEVVSSSVWAGASSPIILALYDAGGRIDDTSARVTVQLSARGGTWADSPTAAAAVQPFGVTDVSYVARPSIPGPGWWSLAITATSAGGSATTRLDVAALDPGNTPSFGAAAPTVRTPTLADVGGDIRRISTDPIPDRRLYGTSTADALAARQPFVLVIDSTKFRTSPACGKALVMARYLQDRWPAVPFIHLEPFEYSIVSDTAVLTGTLSDPRLVPAAEGWGIAGGPWIATSMPWIFIVDGNGLVRGKYQGVIGSADIDVLVALIEQGG